MNREPSIRSSTGEKSISVARVSRDYYHGDSDNERDRERDRDSDHENGRPSSNMSHRSYAQQFQQYQQEKISRSNSKQSMNGENYGANTGNDVTTAWVGDRPSSAAPVAAQGAATLSRPVSRESIASMASSVHSNAYEANSTRVNGTANGNNNNNNSANQYNGITLRALRRVINSWKTTHPSLSLESMTIGQTYEKIVLPTIKKEKISYLQYLRSECQQDREKWHEYQLQCKQATNVPSSDQKNGNAPTGSTSTSDKDIPMPTFSMFAYGGRAFISSKNSAQNTTNKKKRQRRPRPLDDDDIHGREGMLVCCESWSANIIDFLEMIEHHLYHRYHPTTPFAPHINPSSPAQDGPILASSPLTVDGLREHQQKINSNGGNTGTSGAMARFANGSANNSPRTGTGGNKLTRQDSSDNSFSLYSRDGIQAIGNGADHYDPETLPLWIDFLCICPMFPANETTTKSKGGKSTDSRPSTANGNSAPTATYEQHKDWSRHIQNIVRLAPRVLFILLPWNQTYLFDSVQSFFMLYWTMVQNHHFQIAFPENSVDFCQSVSTNPRIDQLIESWALQGTDITKYEAIGTGPVYGGKALKKMLLTITTWENVIKDVSLLLKSELRKISATLKGKLRSSTEVLMSRAIPTGIVSNKGHKGSGGTIQQPEANQNWYVDSLEAELRALDIKVATAKTLIVTASAVRAEEKYKHQQSSKVIGGGTGGIEDKKFQSRIKQGQEEIELLLKNIIEQCKRIYDAIKPPTTSVNVNSQTNKNETNYNNLVLSDVEDDDDGPLGSNFNGSRISTIASRDALDRVMSFMCEVAELYVFVHAWNSAMTLLQECWEYYCSRYQNEKHIQALHCYGLLGVCYHQQGDYTQGEEILTDVVSLLTETVGPTHSDCMLFSYHLGLLYYDLGRYTASEPLLTNVYSHQCIVYGLQHSDTLKTMLKLAYLFNIQRKFSHAEEMLTTYITHSRGVLGKYHSDVLNAKQNLANLYAIQWKYDEAEAIYREILDIYKGIYGLMHNSTLDIMVTIGHIYLRQERFRDAEDVYLLALQHATALYGSAMPGQNGPNGGSSAAPSPFGPVGGSETAATTSAGSIKISSYCHPLIKLYRGYYEKALEAALEHETMLRRDIEREKLRKMEEEIMAQEAKRTGGGNGNNNEGNNSGNNSGGFLDRLFGRSSPRPSSAGSNNSVTSSTNGSGSGRSGGSNGSLGSAKRLKGNKVRAADVDLKVEGKVNKKGNSGGSKNSASVSPSNSNTGLAGSSTVVSPNQQASKICIVS